MARTSTPLSCFVFHSILLGASASSPRDCGVRSEATTPSGPGSWSAVDAEQSQGLELLQVTSKKVGFKSAKDKQRTVRLLSDRENSTWFSRFENESEFNDSFKQVKPLRAQQVDLPHSDDNLDLSNESRAYVRFLAQHKQWRDFIDFYKDGFFQRFFSNDAGTWTIKNGKLSLDWLQGGTEELRTSDLGRSFVRGEEFELRSHYVPNWFEELLKKSEAKEEVPEWNYEYLYPEDRSESEDGDRSGGQDSGGDSSNGKDGGSLKEGVTHYVRSIPTQSYSADKEDVVLKHEMNAPKAGWECYVYNRSAGESDGWCKTSPKRDGYEYAYNGGLFHPCGNCWCCSRKESDVLEPLPEELESNTSEVEDLQREEQAAIEAAQQAARKAEEAARRAGEEERAAEEADAAAAAAAAKATAAAHKAAQEGERADEAEFAEKRVALEEAASEAAAERSIADAKLKKAKEEKAIAAETKAAKDKAAAVAAEQRAAAEEKLRKAELEKAVAAKETAVAAEKKAAQEEAAAQAAEEKAVAEEERTKAEEEKATAEEKQAEAEAIAKKQAADRKKAAKQSLNEDTKLDAANKKKAKAEEEEAQAAALKAKAEAVLRKAAKEKARAEAREALEKAAKTKTATDAKLRQLAAKRQQRLKEVEEEAAAEEREAEEKERAAKQVALKRLADSQTALQDEAAAEAEAKKAGWQCYLYNKTAGENDQWCMKAPKRAGYEFSYNGGLSKQCDGCWCCTRREPGALELAQAGDRGKKEKAQQHALALSIRGPWSFW